MRILFNTVIPVPFVLDVMEEMAKLLSAEMVYVFEKKSLKRRKQWNTAFDGIYLEENKDRTVSFVALLEEKLPDLVLFAHYRSDLTNAGIKWCKKNKVKYVIGPHEIIVPVNYLNPQILYRKGSFLNYLIQELKYFTYKRVTKGASGVITMGNNSVKNISKIYNGPIANIPYSFNMDHLYENNCEKTEELIFLYSGQLIWNRNPVLCIESFAALVKNNPRKKLKLIISGKGTLDQTCRDTIDQLDIADRVEWITEFKDWYDIHTIYGKAHVLLALQTFSTWGLIIQEAMASGMSIISTYDMEGADNLIIHRYNGFLTTLDKRSILRYMQYYIDNEEVLKLHKERNREISRVMDSRYVAKELGDFITSIHHKSIN